MKKISVFTAILTAAALVLPYTSGISAYADSPPPLPTANSQTRHIDCTSLSDMAEDYYTGEYSIDKLMSLKGADDTSTSLAAMQDNPLFDALHSLMNDTQTFYTSYSGSKEGSLAYYWNKTDAVESSDDFVSFYSDIIYGASSPEGKKYSMEREHIWPKSNASYYQTNGGADLHHLRPSVSAVNQAKSNYRFADINTVYPAGNEEVYYNDTLYAWINSENELFECKDDVKGDAARILLYVYCRWKQPNLYSDVATEYLPEFDSDDTSNYGSAVIESLDTLLEWMDNDPVDTWEMERNDLIEQIQGNRNVFIDYPELAWKMFGREIPEHIQTPTHKGCHHDYAVTELTPSDCQHEGSMTQTCRECGQAYIHQLHTSLHQDEDNDRYCDHCGESTQFTMSEQISEGDHIMLVSKADNRTPMKEEKNHTISMIQVSITENSLFKRENAAVFYVEGCENGFFLKNKGTYLSADEKGKLYYADTPVESSVWQFSKTDDNSFILTCINSPYTNKKTGESFPRMLETYKGNLSLYYMETPDDSYKFYVYNCDHHIADDKTEADCVMDKSVICECEVCGESFTKNIPPKGHTESEPIIENELPASYDKAGGYDTVIYCTDCGMELSRVHTVTEPLDNKQIATDETLLKWAENDYLNKTGRKVNASADVKNEGKLNIILKDKNEAIADTYIIDTATGTGVDSANMAIDLPQTGIDHLPHILIVSFALLMLTAGSILIIPRCRFRIGDSHS